MKQGWEIKKLVDVCDIVGGSTPKTGELSYWNGEHYWVTPAELDGTKYISSTSRTITDEGVKSAHLQLLPSGTVLLSSRAPIGKVAITTVPMYCNQGFKNLICSESLCNEYAYWFLYHNTKYLNSLGAGATFKEISKRVVEQISILVPPLSVQEKIVAELDCLSGIIEKKKQQLKEYDALAQSIFYEMFGNPIDNEKGWEMCTIDSLCSSIVRGPFGSALKKEYFIEPTQTAYKVYEQKHAIQKNAEIGTYYISAERFATLSRFEVKAGDIIMSCSGTIGELFEIPIGAEKGLMNQALLKFTLNNRIEKIYFLFAMECVKDSFDRKGTGLQNIGSVGTIKKTQISLPKISLQQEFASKIEAIEKQKELLKQSIAETETLFNSRMDYYFN